MSDPLDSLETDEEYAKKAADTAKKYKVLKPGDKGVQVIKLEADPSAPKTPAPPAKADGLGLDLSAAPSGDSKPTVQAFRMLGDMAATAVPLESVLPRTLPLESVLPGAALAPDAPPAPPAPQDSPPSRTDQDIEAEYLKRVASDPAKPQNINREALQYKLLHPEMSFDSIEQNLDTLRNQAAAARVNWQEVTQQHPVLAKLIQRDPATMQLALSEAPTLQGLQSAIGFVPDKSSAVGFRYVPGGLMERFGRGLNYGTAKIADQFGAYLATAWANHIKDATIPWIAQQEPAYRAIAKQLMERADLNEKQLNIDTHGDNLKNSWAITRGIAGVADSTAVALPFAMEQAALAVATGGHSIYATLALNSVVGAGDVFAAAKARGMSDEKAVGAATVGGPVVGAALSASPLSRMADGFTSATTKSAIRKVLEGGVGKFRAIWTTLARGGLDAASGQLALGVQRGAEELAVADKGKDFTEAGREFLRGTFTDPSLLGFHAMTLLGAVGQAHRSAKGISELQDLVRNAQEAAQEPAAAALRGEATGEIAAQPGAHRAIYLPLDRYLEATDKLGKDPRQLATDIMKDGGAAYDIALATRSDHLKIPIERHEAAIKEGLADAINEHGRFEQSLLSKADLEQQGAWLKTTFDAEYRAATKLDPDTLTGEDAALYRAAQAHATLVGMEDGNAAPRLIAEVRTLAKLHPEMTHREIFDGLFGKGGLYGQEKGKAPEPQRLVEIAKSLSGHDDQRWFGVFKEEQEQAAAKTAAEKADTAASDTLKSALVNNDRRFMESSRDAALSEAKKLAEKNPAIMALRALRGDVSHLPMNLRMDLTRPDGKPFRLLDTEVDSILGPGSADSLKEKLGNAITSDPKKAMPVRDMAQLLGYDHSPQGLAEKNLLWDLRQTPTEKEFVTKAAQAVLDARYGPDLLVNPSPLMGAALDAVHTPQASERLLGLYRKLAEGLDPTTQARSAMTSAQWREHAERLIGLKSLEEIDPHFFAKSEGSRIKQALSAADKGEAAEAARHAESALLYHHLYLAAREAADAAGRARRDLARSAASEAPVRRLGFADPHAGDDGMNPYQRGREAALVAAGLLPARAGTDYSRAVEDLVSRAAKIGHDEYLDGLNWNPAVVQKLIDNKSGWGALTPDEARQLHAFVRNIETIGTKAEEARGGVVDGRSAQIANFLRGGEKPGAAREPVEPLYLDKNLQKSEEQAGAKGVLAKAKDIALALPRMLGATDTPSNWQSEYLLRHLGPVGVAIQDFKRRSYILRNKILSDLYGPWKEIHDRTMLDPEVHEEAVGAINDLAPDRKGQVDVDRVTYGWLLNLARWYGDADGRDRIMKGFGLTPDRVEAVLSKYLTKEQLDNIQAEKDLIDREWYPRLAEAYLRRTGNPLPKSEAAGFEINGVKYRGGHVQLTYDERPGMGLDLRRALNDSTLGTRAIMENGFFHKRVGSPGALPDLSNLTAPQTMLDMAHHLAIGDFLLDTKEVLLNPDTAGVINRYVGDNAAKVIQGWLSRIATETRGGPDRMEPGQRESVRAMRAVRTGTVLAFTTGKLTIPFAHATHPFMAGAMLHGYGYAAKYTLPAFTDMLTGVTRWLATGTNDFTERAQADSAYLRLRKTSTPDDIAKLYFQREVAQSGAPKATIDKVQEGLERYGTLPLRMMDEVFSATIYQARYNHAMDTLDRTQFGSHDEMHAEAVRLAEAEVDRAMPNFAQHAISSYAASKHGFQSIITPLMGYYATVRDLYRSSLFEKVDGSLRAYEAAHGTEAPPWYRAGQSIMWQAKLAMPVILGLGLGAYLKGSGPKQEEDAPEWAQLGAGYWQREFWPTAGSLAADAGMEAVKRMSELHPMVGSLTERGMEAWGTRRFVDYTPSSVIFSPFTDVGRAVEKTRLDKFTAGDAALSWGRALSPALGLPAAPVVNIGGLALNYDEFRDNLPTSKAAQAIDVLDHLTFSHQWGRGAKYQARTPLSDLKEAVDTAVKTDKGGHRRLPW